MNIDLESQRKLLQSYKENFRLPIESHLNLRDKKAELVQFRLNPSQTLLHKFIQSHRRRKKPVRFIILKGRQLGISTYLSAFQLFRTILYPGVSTLTICHEKKSSQEMLAKVKMFYNQLPEWLRPMRKYYTRDYIEFDNPKEQDRIVRPGLNSKFYTDSAEKPEVGRSFTFQSIHMSEVSVWDKKPLETFEALMQTMHTVPETFAFIESSPKGAQGLFYELWKEATKDPEEGWRPIFFPFYINPEYRIKVPPGHESYLIETLNDDELRIARTCKLNIEQIAWMKNTIQVGHNGVLTSFLQEYAPLAEECFLVEGDTIFNREVIRRYAKKARSTGGAKFTCITSKTSFNVRLEKDPDGHLEVWEGVQKDHLYVMGIDPSSGIPGRDRSCIQILRIGKDKPVQVAEFVCDSTPPHHLAKIAVFLARTYNDALVMPEATGVGVPFVAILREEYYNVGHWERIDKRVPTLSGNYGFDTNSKTGPMLKNRIISALQEEDVEIFSRNIVQEMTTFVRLKDGNIGAAKQKGCHDDCLMALGLALMGLEQAAQNNTNSVIYTPDDSDGIWLPQGFMSAMGYHGEDDYEPHSWMDY